MQTTKFWTSDQEDFLRLHWRDMTDAEIGEAIGRSASGVCNKRKILDLRRPPHIENPWTRKDDAYIQENYRVMNDEEIGRELSRSTDAVSHRRRHLCLPCVAKSVASHMRWNDGHRLKTAEEFVASLGPIPNYEIVALIQVRIQEATTCLMHLHANGPSYKMWSKADEGMNAKLQLCIRDLKRAQDVAYRSTGAIQEAA